MLRCAVFLCLSGCGLVLNVDPEPQRPVDGAVYDGGVSDAWTTDGGGTDATVGMDGGVVDASVTDAAAPPLPTILEVSFVRGLASLPAASGLEQEKPLPFRVAAVEFVVSTTMDHALMEASIRGTSGPAVGAIEFADAGGQTHIKLPIEGVPLPDGDYCLQVRSSPSSGGILLDGEWRSAFPSGDMSPGGDFAYGFSVLQGDLNGDRHVDGADYTILADAFDTTSPRADLNGSGWVDSEDYDLWRESFDNALSESVSIRCDIARL